MFLFRILALLTLAQLLFAEPARVRVFSTARDILRLSQTTADLGQPVELRATVTVAGPSMLFVQDATAGIYVLISGKPSVRAGDQVLIKGKTAGGYFAPEIHPESIRIISHGKLPAPKKLAFSALWNPTLECRYVEFQGTLRSVVRSGDRYQVTLQNQGLIVSGVLYSEDSSSLPHTGDEVRVEAVLASIFNSKGQWLAPRLHIQSAADFHLIRSNDSDDSKLPISRIGDLLRYNFDRPPLLQRVRARGVVTTLAADNNMIAIQDGDSGIFVRKPEMPSVAVGDSVEVIGFPALNGYSPTIEDTSLTRVEGRAHILPLAISVKDAETGKHDARLVQLAGVLVLKERSKLRSLNRDRVTLTMREETGQIFTAEIIEDKDGPLDDIPIGSKLRLIGVCQNTAAPRIGLQNPFIIRMSSAADINVMQVASWWTLERATVVLSVLLPVGSLVLIWIYVLRRRVQRQRKIISNQLRLETALAERYRDLFENATDLVFTIDVSGRFTALNQAAQQMFGCSEIEGKQLQLQTLVLEEDGPVLRDVLAMLLGGEHSVLRQMRVDTRNGQRLTLEMNCRLRHGSDGPSSIDIIARDVTQHKREKAELEQARAAAEAASRAKSEFLANMSHEIRTPMNGILGMTELTLETQLSEDQRTNLTIVRKSAEALLTIINDILDFSKIEAGRMEIERTPFDFPSLVENCLDLIALPAGSKGLELVCDIDPALPHEWIGDAARLRQILTNLLGNAVKFTHQGQVVLRVDREAGGTGVCKARFEVSDTGIGIPPEQHEHIFGMFCQADGSTSRKYGGTGLGLAITSRLVGLIGGKLELTSTPGEGSNFSFTTIVEAVQEDPVVVRNCAQGTTARIVNVHPATAKAIERVLSHAGVERVSEGGSVVISEQVMRTSSPLILLLAPGRPAATNLEDIAAMVRKPISPVSLIKAIRELKHNRSMLALKHIEQPLRIVAPPPASAGNNDRATILLAEDNKVNQLLAVRTLEKFGFKVLVANNGIEAVEVASASAVDLVLMDIQMPEMDGFEATGRIRQLCDERGTPQLPVIAMTAHALKGDRERCLGGGMTDYIAKPVRPGELLNMIERYLPKTA